MTHPLAGDPRTTHPATTFRYAVEMQVSYTFSATVEATSSADAMVIIGDQVRAGDTSGLEQTQRVIEHASSRRIS